MQENKPTEAQLKEFWEWCGLYKEERGAWSGKVFYSWFTSPTKAVFICDNSPPIDLNNLFKYAVPKLEEILGRFDTDILLRKWIRYYLEDKGKLTSWLFWAIWEVMKKRFTIGIG